MISVVHFAGQSVFIDYPSRLNQLVGKLFGEVWQGPPPRHVKTITLEETGDDRFNLITADGAVSAGLDIAGLHRLLMKVTVRALVSQMSDAVALRATWASRDGKSILLPGRPSLGGSVLAAWMASHGYTIHSGEMVAFNNETREPSFFSYPLIMTSDVLQTLEQADIKLQDNDDLHEFGLDGLLQFSQDSTHALPGPVKLLLFPDFHKGETPSLRSVGGVDAALRLFSNVLNTAELADGGLGVLSSLARSVPSVEIRFGNLAEMEGVLCDLLAQISLPGLDVVRWHRMQSRFSAENSVALATPHVANPPKINEPTPRRGPVRLTVGMATYDDYDGVYFTIQSLRLNNRALESELEFLVIDNHPDGPCADALKAMESISANYRYIPYHGHSGTAVRDLLFAEASGEFVMCLDCHVLLEPDALARLLGYLDDNPDTTNLLQGPLVDDNLSLCGTHFEPLWQKGMYGVWSLDPRGDNPDAEPFDIPSQGLGLFVSRRDTWPGFNPKFRGFGGEEGYIHEKFRKRGDRTLCLPFLRWMHRFRRPHGVPYQLTWEDRIRNYILGFRELKLDEAPIAAHFTEMLGADNYDRIEQAIHRELDNPFNAFDALRLINLDCRPDRFETMQRRFRKLGIGKLVNRFAAIATPQNHHIGCALSHRAIIEDARRRKLRNVLVFEDDAIFHRSSVECMSAVLDELHAVEWDLLYLGGYVRDEEGVPLCKGSLLRQAKNLTCCHAIAYNESIYDIILGELPDSEEKMAIWIEDNLAIDRYLTSIDAVRLVPEPMLALQCELFEQSKSIDRSHFDE